MKKMNRSQSSFRQCKTLINEDESQNWMNKYASRHHPPLKQLVNPNINSINDPNKENNSLYQSISQRNFVTKSTQEISQFDPGQSISRKLQQKCKQQELELKKLYAEREEYLRVGMSSTNSKNYNYAEKYYQSQIESLKGVIKQKDRELQFYKQQYSSKSEDMDSMSSELSCKMQRDNKEKNMYIRQINAKVIENNNLLQRLKIHKAQIDTLKLCINQKDKNLQQFEDKLGQVDMKKKKVEHYEYQMKQYNEMLKQIEARTQKLKEEADAKDIIINDKTKSIVQLEQTIGSYQDKLRAIEESLIRISEDKKSIMDRNQELARECSDWKQSYDDLLKKSQSIQEYEIKLKTYLSMLEDLNRKNMELMSVNEKYRINYVTLQKNIAKYQDMDKEMSNLKRQLKDREEKLIDFQVKEKAYRHLEDTYAKMKKQKDELMTKYQQKIKQNKNLSMQLEEHRNRSVMLQEELQEIEQNNNRAKQRGQKMQILMKENNRLTSSLHQKVNQIEKLQIKINNMQIKLNEKGNEMLKMKSIIEQNQQEIHQTKLEVQDLRERYEIETNNRILNEDKVLRCTQEIFAQKCTITKLQTENNQINQKIVEISSNHQIQMEELTQLISQMNQSKIESQNLLIESKSKLEALRQEIDSCKTELFDSTIKEKEHRNEITKLQDYIVQLTQDIYNLKQEKSQIIQKCKQLKEIHDFVMKFKDLPEIYN